MVQSTRPSTTMFERIDSFLPFRWWWCIPLGVILQMSALAFVRTNEELRWLKVTLVLGSYCFALAPVWANRERWGVRIVGLGIALNLIAILANGGLMPVSPQARELTGKQAVAPVNDVGQMVPKSKGVLLTPEQTNLYLLTDVIALGPPISKAISPGDVLIYGGVVFLGAEMLVVQWMNARRTVQPSPEG
jgi:hypothetical protein